ncbi:hypothetical protein RclHR1_33230002 [Rhizophagus clarus]|uniref:Uncharacterized protein n=1 Tax=Rhizophagus clarus TaxID=94130 RepID=A0A2Z6S3Z6_9GLOM|nr:hypothetical protein RclHR1_33230002 [Rhizophagus clarus]
MTSANQTLTLDDIKYIDNSYNKNNNNILVNNGGDKEQIERIFIGNKEQIERSNVPHNEDSHSFELVNQCEKDVAIYLSRQRLIFEAGHYHNNIDQS